MFLDTSFAKETSKLTYCLKLNFIKGIRVFKQSPGVPIKTRISTNSRSPFNLAGVGCGESFYNTKKGESY